MNDDFNELYDMLRTERKDVLSSLNIGYEEINNLLSKIRNYKLNEIQIEDEFNMNTEKEKFMIEDIQIKSKMENDFINYKISLLQHYLQDLFAEKKFNDYKRDKERTLSTEEYLEYTKNPSNKTTKRDEWYKEFMEL